MERLNLSRQGIHTMSKIWNVHYHFMNHAEANHPMLLRKGVKGYQTGTLGGGHNMIQ